MKIALFLFLSLSVYANSFLENYRVNGIKEIEKQMDLEFTKKAYWSEHIKNKDTKFGYIEAYASVLTCDKNLSTLSLYIQDENQTFKLQTDYNAFTGEVKGDKIKEGDLKTPIGIYRITKKIDKVDSFYGPLAFVTSYPNMYDKYRGKTGSGIWIHGLPIKQERDEFTKGCIAINNTDIKCLDDTIDIEKTLLIINKTKLEKEVSKEVLSSILAQLYEWRYSWIYSDIDSYLKFYANNFVRYDGMKIDKFSKYKTRVFKKNESKTIIFDNINVVPYPNGPDVYQITFKEIYSSQSFKFIGNKTLIIKVNENNNIKIITEK